jgi:hypothetical protein
MVKLLTEKTSEPANYPKNISDPDERVSTRIHTAIQQFG